MKRGSILIIVLWSLFLLSMLAVAVNAYTRPHLDLAEKLKERAGLYYLAKAGVKRAILEIKNDETDSYDALNDSWSNNEEAFKEIELYDGIFTISYDISHRKSESEEVRYGLMDEERRLNINKASYAVLKNFFEIAGEVDTDKAGDIADSIIDWRDKDDKHGEVSEDGSYSMDYPYKNNDFEVLEELLLVKGMTQKIFDKIKDRITVYGGGAVNINTADELVLQSLGMDKGLAGKIIHFRRGNDGKEGTEDDNIFEETGTIANVLGEKEILSGTENSEILKLISTGLICVQSDNFRGQSIAKPRYKETSAKIVFVFDRRNRVLKYWKEE